MWFCWLEHHPICQNVGGSFPSQGTYLGCGLNQCKPLVAYGWQPIDFSLSRQKFFSLSLSISFSPLPLSLKINKHINFLKYKEVCKIEANNFRRVQLLKQMKAFLRGLVLVGKNGANGGNKLSMETKENCEIRRLTNPRLP